MEEEGKAVEAEVEGQQGASTRAALPSTACHSKCEPQLREEGGEGDGADSMGKRRRRGRDLLSHLQSDLSLNVLPPIVAARGEGGRGGPGEVQGGR